MVSGIDVGAIAAATSSVLLDSSKIAQTGPLTRGEKIAIGGLTGFGLALIGGIAYLLLKSSPTEVDIGQNVISNKEQAQELASTKLLEHGYNNADELVNEILDINPENREQYILQLCKENKIDPETMYFLISMFHNYNFLYESNNIYKPDTITYTNALRAMNGIGAE